MSCWIPGPWEEAWAPGLRLKRQRAQEAAAATKAAAALERKQKAAAKRKAANELAAIN